MLQSDNQEEYFDYYKLEGNRRNLQRTFDSTYKCGECIYNGYKSCIGKSNKDHAFLSSYTKTDNTLNGCCQQTDYCSDSSSGWSCSAYYNNTLYAKYNCPFNTAVCGANDTYNISSIGGVANLTMIMTRGEVCFYKVKNSCGRAKVDLIQVDNSASILIEYLEFESGQIITGTGYIEGRTGGAPAAGMPYRTETFVYDNQRKVYQGRLYAGEGFHMWGSYSQGQTADLPSGTQSCADRNTYIIVTSVTDTTSTIQLILFLKMRKQLKQLQKQKQNKLDLFLDPKNQVQTQNDINNSTSLADLNQSLHQNYNLKIQSQQEVISNLNKTHQKSPLKQKNILNSKQRVIEFTNRWHELLDSKFTEKSSTFDKHYQKVVQNTTKQFKIDNPHTNFSKRDKINQNSQIDINIVNTDYNTAPILAIGMEGKLVKPDVKNVLLLGNGSLEVDRGKNGIRKNVYGGRDHQTPLKDRLLSQLQNPKIVNLNEQSPTSLKSPIYSQSEYKINEINQSSPNPYMHSEKVTLYEKYKGPYSGQQRNNYDIFSHSPHSKSLANKSNQNAQLGKINRNMQFNIGRQQSNFRNKKIKQAQSNTRIDGQIFQNIELSRNQEEQLNSEFIISRPNLDYPSDNNHQIQLLKEQEKSQYQQDRTQVQNKPHLLPQTITQQQLQQDHSYSNLFKADTVPPYEYGIQTSQVNNYVQENQSEIQPIHQFREQDMQSLNSDAYGLGQVRQHNQQNQSIDQTKILEVQEENLQLKKEREQLIKEIEDLSYFSMKNTNFMQDNKIQIVPYSNRRFTKNYVQRPYSSNIYSNRSLYYRQIPSNKQNSYIESKSDYQSLNYNKIIRTQKTQQYESKASKKQNLFINNKLSHSKQGLQTPDFYSNSTMQNNKIINSNGSTANLTRNLNTASGGLSTFNFQSKNLSQSKSLARKNFKRSAVVPNTNIGIVDQYYKILNNDQEIESIKFMNEYRRLFETLDKIWSTNSHLIPIQEQNFVHSVLDYTLNTHSVQSLNNNSNQLISNYGNKMSQITLNDLHIPINIDLDSRNLENNFNLVQESQYNRGIQNLTQNSHLILQSDNVEKIKDQNLCDQEVRSLILLRLNQYINKTQKFITINNQLQSLIQERESAINTLKMLAQCNNLNEFMNKDRGSNMLQLIRDLSLRIISKYHLHLSFLITDEVYNQPLLYEHDTNVQRCYLCKLKYHDHYDISTTSHLFIKLSIFLLDFVTLAPRNKDETKQIIDEKLEKDDRYFTMSEITQFEKLVSSFGVNEGSKISNQIYSFIELIKNHNCGNQQVVKINQTKKLTTKKINNARIKNQNSKFKNLESLFKYEGFFKFVWNFRDDSSLNNYFSRENRNFQKDIDDKSKPKINQPLVLFKEYEQLIVNRESLQNRAQMALSQLKNIIDRENKAKIDLSNDLNDRIMEENGKQQSSQFISINQMQPDATYRESIAMFYNKGDDSQNLNQPSQIYATNTNHNYDAVNSQNQSIPYETVQDQDSFVLNEQQQQQQQQQYLSLKQQYNQSQYTQQFQIDKPQNSHHIQSKQKLSEEQNRINVSTHAIADAKLVNVSHFGDDEDQTVKNHALQTHHLHIIKPRKHHNQSQDMTENQNNKYLLNPLNQNQQTISQSSHIKGSVSNQQISQSVTQLNFYSKQDELHIVQDQKSRGFNLTPPQSNSTKRVSNLRMNQPLMQSRDKGYKKNIQLIDNSKLQAEPPKLQNFRGDLNENQKQRPYTEQISKRPSLTHQHQPTQIEQDIFQKLLNENKISTDLLQKNLAKDKLQVEAIQKGSGSRNRVYSQNNQFDYQDQGANQIEVDSLLNIPQPNLDQTDAKSEPLEIDQNQITISQQ